MTTCVVEESPGSKNPISALEGIIVIVQKDGTRIKGNGLYTRLRIHGLEK
jgi:hypothetical protein